MLEVLMDKLIANNASGIYVSNVSKESYDKLLDYFLNLGYGVDLTDWFDNCRVLINFSRREVSVYSSRPAMFGRYYELDMGGKCYDN